MSKLAILLLFGLQTAIGAAGKGVGPPLSASAIGSGTTCGYVNGSITAIATGGVTPYTYALNSGPVQAGPVFYNLDTGTYVLAVEDAAGHIALDTLTLVNLYNPPGLNYSFNFLSGCSQPDTLIMHGVGGNPPYLFSFDNIHYLEDTLYLKMSAGSYTIFERDADGCTTEKVISIINECNFEFNLTLVNPDCTNNDGSVTVHPTVGTPPYNFTLNGGISQSDSTFRNLSSGVYQVTIGSASAAPVTFGFSLYTSCLKLSATLLLPCGTGPTDIKAEPALGVPPYSYSLDGMTFQASNTFLNVATGAYTVTVKDAAGATATTTVNIAATDSLALAAGPPLEVCDGLPVTLPASSNGYGFHWSPGVNDSTDLQPRVLPTQTTTYYVTATRGTCSRTDSVLVTVLRRPVAEAGKDSTVCNGSDLRLFGTAAGAGTSPRYAWSPTTYLDNPTLADPFVVSPARSVTYGLVVTGPNGCPSIADSTTVTVLPPPLLSAGNDTNLLQGQPLPLQAVDINHVGFNTYTWSPPTGLSNPFVQDPVALPPASVNYQVVALSPEGCQGAATIAVKVFSKIDIYVPGAFTPNGDGHNDLLRAVPAGIRTFGYLTIYDRWGKRVFRTTTPDNGWDGTFGGILQNPGAYVWEAAGTDYNGQLVSRRGTVLLIR